MRAKKSLGQNFLMHARTAERIADAAGLTKHDTVLEIGPGTGMLTTPLVARAGKVIAIEADASLVSRLEERFESEIKNKDLMIIHDDIRAFDPETLKGKYALVANIPYYLTGQIIRDFLGSDHKPESMTLLVQKEVAERIARAKKESLLSVAVKIYGKPRYAFTVPKGAFVPAPKVDSAVITISDIHSPFRMKAHEKLFFDVLRAGFAHKRKLLARNLESVASQSTIREAFRAAKIESKARAEDLSVADWQAIASKIA